ncbi:hypothetical protein LPW11_02855 [Geomonas sp. RF6]|uniref:fimbrial biogenesis chaperone n=1 Tax=Geomonas sp. RF6 TaxID=2897342 RepID=UPI001E4346EF|nr:hypothetical protein [Geomonas sp. RF6]UFS71139.1 hypothetical protein LPW11_02855 [Geomonas sp. RF6]
MKKVFAVMAIPALVGFLILFNAPISAAAPDLMIYPTRVVMSDKVKSAQVDIINTSQTQASYKIGLARKRMTESGEFKDVSDAEPDERFADDVVKYSPRQVTLLPGAGQTIRIMFKPSAEMADGEYRSHLVFAKVASGISQLPEPKEQDPKTLTMKITTNVNISIPVIVRHGQLEAEASIDPSSITLTALQPSQQQVNFTLARKGTRSIYGEVALYRGKEKIAVMDNFAVYVPNSHRKVSMHILEPHQLKPGDAVQVVFTEKGESRPLAEASAVLR